MKYIGIQEQIRRNNRKSVLLLIAFPTVLLLSVYAVVFLMQYQPDYGYDLDYINQSFLNIAPIVTVVVGIWFAIAYFGHTKMISMATGAKPLERKSNMKIYNLVENLCISQGMRMPKVEIIESSALNAYASGIDEKTYTVTLTRGIIEALEEDELEGVIAHELMHIQNRDVRLLVVSIIFVGIFTFIMEISFRSMLYGGGRRNNKDSGKFILVILVVSVVAYLLTMLFRFSLSRSREYMADSGAAAMTRKPWALASALKKISGHHHIKDIKSEEIKQMFIENTPDKKNANIFSSLSGLFATHPPIEKRIAFLEKV
ncbi:MAG TPA: M48 family metallopeptidase [Flavobacterium sp.]|uniref:M48 family metallopeptidase n=1 Tax=unclassified Flavobacterium TaxID=196869 RepID=UPI000E934E19|nr:MULTISPECIES: M48 family metallopeptidase [unclassified Flavobacterium]HBI00806.1 protease [Flavobacterium sp.]HRE79151.1 M48 family metallopeptidase [Flavobacterium sp.]